VNNPVVELVPAATMKGFIDDYSHYTEDVLFLQGEIHGDRKPVCCSVLTPLFITRRLPDLSVGFHDLYVSSWKR